MILGEEKYQVGDSCKVKNGRDVLHGIVAGIGTKDEMKHKEELFIEGKFDVPYVKNHTVNTMTTLRTATRLVGDKESDIVPVLGATVEVIDWYSLGLALDLPYYLLDTISQDNHTTNECRYKMLKSWLETGSASWFLLAKALQCPLINHYKAAEEILENLDINSALESAMEKGGGKLNPCNITLHGPPGVGKTSLKRVILGQPPLPEEEQNSTNIMENPARAISTKQWTAARGQLLLKEVDKEELIKMLAKAVESLRRQETLQHDSSDHHRPEFAVQPIPHITPAISSLKPPLRSLPKLPDTPHPIPPGTLQPKHSLTSSDAIKSMKVHLEHNINPSAELFDYDWIHLIDSGGQPQFLDVLPLLYCNESLHIVVIRLDIGLDDKPEFCYTVKGKNIAPPSYLRLSNREFIEMFCQVAEAQAISGKYNPKVIVVGTHKDKLGIDFEAKLKKINKEMTKIHENYNRVLVCKNKSTDEIVYAINAMADGEERQHYTENLQKDILKEAKKTGDGIDVPLKWLVFHLDLQKKGDIVSKSEWIETGNTFEMEETDVENALKYFKKVALLLYFPDDVPDIAFTNFKPLICRLSRLIAASFTIPEGCVTEPYDRLKTKGLFNKSFLPTLFEDLYKSEKDFHNDDFLKLLECLKIAVCVGDDDYFLPSALALDNPSSNFPSMSCIPFVFSWDEQFLPHGFFLTLLVELLQKKESVYFELRKNINQCRHEIQFTVAKRRIPGVVKLVDRKRWIEVCYSGSRDNCSQLKEVIDVAVIKVLKVFENTNLEHPIPGFLCNFCDVTEPHCCFLSPDQPVVSCSRDEINYRALTPEMSCWIACKSNEGEGYTSILMKSPEPEDVWDLIKSKSAEWDSIGTQLRVSANTRTSLSRDQKLSDHGRLEKVLQAWKNEQSSEFTWRHLLVSLVSLKFVDLVGTIQRHLSQKDVIEKYEKAPDYKPVLHALVHE